jgi:ribosomal protein S18 acetylase RimI-like enzyme
MTSDPAMTSIEMHAGMRGDLLELFRLADDSEAMIASYLDHGEVLVASESNTVVGHVQILDEDGWQINSLAVAASYRGRGLGRRLVEAAIELARSRGARAIEVATATADVGLLRFYQRLGFRMARIERDVFTPGAGYPAELFVDGMRLIDRVWFDRVLGP